jgi:hypothetical protein
MGAPVESNAYLLLKEHPAKALEWLKLGNPSNLPEIEFGFRVD